MFRFDDGKDVRYNLATGETIGKLGKPVKDICTQLSGYNLLRTIDSFEDDNYQRFLKFIDRNCINKSTAHCGWRRHRVDKIRNVGSFLSRIKDYDYFEQFFACGINDLDAKISYKLNEIPKGLIKICKEYSIALSDNVVSSYTKNPNLFSNVVHMEFATIRTPEVISTLLDRTQENKWFRELVDTHNYRPQSLLTYIDNLMTFEALDGYYNTLRELVDYCNMMIKISPKYEKYPKNFLTTHKIAARNYNRLKEYFDEQEFQKRINKQLEYSYEKYKIIYPESTQAIKDEAVQQNHCVASYIGKVLEGECDILFLRKKDDLEKSLITIEVRNGKVVQARGKFNRDVSRSEQTVIDKYNKKLERLLKAC